jgi:hypothetical protein
MCGLQIFVTGGIHNMVFWFVIEELQLGTKVSYEEKV